MPEKVDITEKHQCSVKVWDDRSFSWQCLKPAKVERDGKWYCSIHDPEYIKAKNKAREEEWERKVQARNAGWERDSIARTAYDQCLLINPDNPLAVAENIGAIYEALRYIASCPSVVQGDVIDIAQKAIAKIK